MLELHDFPNSICAQYYPDYLRLNPKGYVPTLVHDGTAIWESSLIREYLNEAVPDPPDRVDERFADYLEAFG
jgi:glutathione S-transferase